MKPQWYKEDRVSVQLYNLSSRQRRYISTHGQSVTGPCREPNESYIDPITVYLLTSILILSSLTRLGVSILLLPDVPRLAAYSSCTRLCGGTRSWVIWFVFAFRCHIQRTILWRCLQASYYANWIFIIQIPGWYLKFLSSAWKTNMFSSHFGEAVDMLTFLYSFYPALFYETYNYESLGKLRIFQMQIFQTHFKLIMCRLRLYFFN